jgi:hypothetical protein
LIQYCAAVFRKRSTNEVSYPVGVVPIGQQEAEPATVAPGMRRMFLRDDGRSMWLLIAGLVLVVFAGAWLIENTRQHTPTRLVVLPMGAGLGMIAQASALVARHRRLRLIAKHRPWASGVILSVLEADASRSWQLMLRVGEAGRVRVLRFEPTAAQRASGVEAGPVDAVADANGEWLLRASRDAQPFVAWEAQTPAEAAAMRPWMIEDDGGRQTRPIDAPGHPGGYISQRRSSATQPPRRSVAASPRRRPPDRS